MEPMPRKPGPHSADRSEALAVRVPVELAAQVRAACGGQENFSEWARNLFRAACRIPLNYEVGYQEGYSAGWAAANAKLRAALKKVA